MPTLKQYRRQMLQMVPYEATGGLGRQFTAESATTTTFVSAALAVGTFSAQKYSNRYLVRADASSTADRERLISNYTASSGTLTHAGANYTDTTPSGEVAEILYHPVFRFDMAIQDTIRRLRRTQRVDMPLRPNTKRYWLGQVASWLTQPDYIVEVTRSARRTISNNRFFDLWNSVNSSGVLQPDDWTVAGSGGTVVRGSETQRMRNSYKATLTRSGTDVTLTQTVGVLWNGVSGDSLRGKSVTAVATVDCGTASTIRLRISDDTTSSNSSYHTGGGTPEELSVTHTVAAAATTLTFQIRVETNDGSYDVYEAYLLGEVSGVEDSDRRDDWPEYPVQYDLEQSAGQMILNTHEYGTPGAMHLYVSREYPGFDATRLAAGTADADSQDAPLIPTATGAIARLYEGLAQTEDDQAGMYGRLAAEWGRRFEALAIAHQGNVSRYGFGTPPLVNRLASPVRRR